MNSLKWWIEGKEMTSSKTGGEKNIWRDGRGEKRRRIKWSVSDFAHSRYRKALSRLENFLIFKKKLIIL